MGGSKVFFGGPKQVTTEAFLTNIIEQRISLDLHELIKLLEEGYGISPDKQKIISVVDASALYYDRIMERIYYGNLTELENLSEEKQKSIMYILSRSFRNGYRISSNIDFERFKNYYEAEYNNAFTEDASIIDYFLQSKAVLFDGRAYTFDADIATTIHSFFEEMDSPCIHINTFFEKYASELFSLGIFSVDILKIFINKSFEDIFCKREYIYLQLDTSPTAIIRKAFEEADVWTVSELYRKFPSLTEETINQVLRRDEFVRVEPRVYMHISRTENHNPS